MRRPPRSSSVSALLLLLLFPFGSVQPWAADFEAQRPWRDYRTIMWLGDSAYKVPEKTSLVFQRLREMGVNAAMVGQSRFDGK